MTYLNIDLQDGEIPFDLDRTKLDIDKPMEEQWIYLKCDVVWIRYIFEVGEFSIGVDYFPTSGPVINPNAVFCLEIKFVNEKTESLDLLKVLISKTFLEYQNSIQQAVDFVMSLKYATEEQIDQMEKLDIKEQLDILLGDD
jgi:hypothetical protein